MNTARTQAPRFQAHSFRFSPDVYLLVSFRMFWPKQKDNSMLPDVHRIFPLVSINIAVHWWVRFALWSCRLLLFHPQLCNSSLCFDHAYSQPSFVGLSIPSAHSSKAGHKYLETVSGYAAFLFDQVPFPSPSPPPPPSICCSAGMKKC